MQRVYVLRGLPASGKTTWCSSMALTPPIGRSVRRVNLDSLRLMLDFNDGSVRNGREHEEVVLKAQDGAILAAVDQGFDVAIDNTHTVQRLPKRYKNLLIGRDVEFKVIDFLDVPVEECIRRDALRPKPVGEAVIRDMAGRIGKWRLTDEWMNDQPVVEPYVPDESLPRAIGFDLDGTLALHVARGPFDFDKLETDAVNVPVARLLRIYHATGIRIILLSGRKGEYRKHTERWLAAHDIPYHELHMRPVGDPGRSDVEVKLELFDGHVRDRVNLLAMYDDRDKVVALWRRLRVLCPQVAYGPF